MKLGDEGHAIVQDFNHYANKRHNWESHWQEIAERFVPAHSHSFNTFNRNLETSGDKRTELIFDSTAPIAVNRCGAILDSLLTPRNSTWHKLMASDNNLNKVRRVQLWFEEVTRLLFKYRYAPKANFASQNQQVFKSLVTYGTGCNFVDELGSESGFRYKSIHLSELHFVENHQGIIDKCFRHFPMTARQAYQKWGDLLPEAIVDALKTAPDKLFYFLHRVQPNENKNPERLDAEGMDFESVYVSIEGKKVLEKGGYFTFPYPTSRYEQSPGEVYGRSPAMEVLPAVKTLNEQKKTLLKQGHRAVDPVLLVHDDGILDSLSLKPGAVNFGGVDANGRPLVHTLPVGNPLIGKELMDDERAVINDAFLITIFQILTDTPQMTATEVMERTREKGILLAPTLGRQQSEYLGPLIEREIDILSRQGILPPMPPELLEAQGEYKVEYDSPLSRAQRAEEASGLMRTVEIAMSAANASGNPNIIDHFDWDAIIPEVAAIQGVPVRWLRSIEQIQGIRESRAQSQQAQEEIQAAPAQAAMLKAVAQAQKA